MSDNDRIKQMIESAVAREGYTVEEWRDDPGDGLTGVIGRFVVAVEDENEGLYEGDEGVLEVSVVGAPQYQNERVWFGFTADGTDGGAEVKDVSTLDPVAKRRP